jgi:hypothetical protein
MIIQLLEINPLATAINAFVEVSPGNTVVQMLAWNANTYKGNATAIDLSYLLQSVDENESLSISNTALGVDKISGLWAIEFSSSASPDFRVPTVPIENPQLGIVADVISYYECVLDKVQNINVKNCRVGKTNCGENESVLFISTLLEALRHTIIFGLIAEAVQIIKTLDELCEICTTCPSYGDNLLHTGYSYKTVDNIIVST